MSGLVGTLPGDLLCHTRHNPRQRLALTEQWYQCSAHWLAFFLTFLTGGRGHANGACLDRRALHGSFFAPSHSPSLFCILNPDGRNIFGPVCLHTTYIHLCMARNISLDISQLEKEGSKSKSGFRRRKPARTRPQEMTRRRWLEEFSTQEYAYFLLFALCPLSPETSIRKVRITGSQAMATSTSLACSSFSNETRRQAASAGTSTRI